MLVVADNFGELNRLFTIPGESKYRSGSATSIQLNPRNSGYIPENGTLSNLAIRRE
jgi:hypothetical protein